MTRVREIARRVSNWGRWGADDERGTVNFITPDVVRRAAACVRPRRYGRSEVSASYTSATATTRAPSGIVSPESPSG